MDALDEYLNGKDFTALSPDTLIALRKEANFLRLEALRLALGNGGSDAIVREKAEAYLAFLKGDPAPEE